MAGGFLYRDSNQYAELCDSKARSGNKLHFHFNAVLTAINIDKIENWLSVPMSKENSSPRMILKQ
jgi:hypothetical protein